MEEKTHFYNLIDDTKVEVVVKLFLERYPELKNNSKDIPKLYDWFISVKDHIPKNVEYRLIFKDSEIEQHVSAYDITGKSKYNYSVAGIGWREHILNAEIDPDALTKYSKEELVVETIWEMSYYGYAEEFRKYLGKETPMKTQIYTWEDSDEDDGCCKILYFI